jgi:IclR family pca regulon transcriptional regulator
MAVNKPQAKNAATAAAKSRTVKAKPGAVNAMPRSEFIQSLEKGLAVIRSFDERHPTRTLSEAAQAVGLSRAAARRFLLTLEALGYVACEGRHFRLLPRTMELGYAYLASQPWWRNAQRIAEKLGAEHGQACAVGVLDRDSVAYVAYAPAVNLPSLVRTVGTRLPVHATAIGRVLLAGIPPATLAAFLKKSKLIPLTPFTCTDASKLKVAVMKAQEDGYSVVNQELEIGLRSIGVPVLDRGGRVTAAMSFSVRDPYFTGERLVKDFLAPLRRAAKEITAGLPT